MNLCVIGSGYVGLTAAAALASRGHRVVCVDKDAHKVRSLRQGAVPFYEPGVRNTWRGGCAPAACGLRRSWPTAWPTPILVFITVGTPADDDGRADLTAVDQVVEGLIEHGPPPKIVVVKSTVPVGTGDGLESRLRRRTGLTWHVVSNPEFFGEGSALTDYLHPDRIVIGAASPDAGERVRRLYADFHRPILMVDRRTAELIKYVANGFLAAANFSHQRDQRLLRASRRRRAGNQRRHRARLSHRPPFLRAGLGLRRLVLSQRRGRPHQPVSRARRAAPDSSRAAQGVNAKRRRRFLQLVRESVPRLEGAAVAVWGLSFKPDTDDLRHGAFPRHRACAAGKGRPGARVRPGGGRRGGRGVSRSLRGRVSYRRRRRHVRGAGSDGVEQFAT